MTEESVAPWKFATVVVVFTCACVTPAEVDTFVKAYTEAMSDGVLTEAEIALLKPMWDQFMASQGGFDWESVAWTAAGIAGSLLGVRIMPNRGILGRKGAEALQPK